MSSCHFERRRIIGMIEAEWSARRVDHQLGHSDCVVRRCWDQWIREMSFTRRPVSERPQQTTRREDHHIAPSLGYASPLCLLELYEGSWLKDI
ncbi:uncharacterized protein TNCV_3172231 [Trichonephila clavipes]|nr:uncharacterized protein TNCV_3172231 [Trichonephila clavipes]